MVFDFTNSTKTGKQDGNKNELAVLKLYQKENAVIVCLAKLC